MFGRADKKRQVRPWVTMALKEYVHDVAGYIRASESETAARLVVTALNDFPTLNRLAPYMWRDYAHGTHAWIGHEFNEDLTPLIAPEGHRLERLTIRFSQEDWASVDALGFAFGRPVAHAAAALLRFAADYPRVTWIVAPKYEPRSPYTIQRRAPQWGGSRTM